MILGLAAWVVFEYAAHRALHLFNNPRHNAHHRSRECESVWAALALVSGGWGVGGLGFGAGAAAYVVVHAVVHKRGRWLPGLAAHHKLHHRDPTVNFGVTTTLLDHLMGTIRVEKGE